MASLAELSPPVVASLAEPSLPPPSSPGGPASDSSQRRTPPVPLTRLQRIPMGHSELCWQTCWLPPLHDAWQEDEPVPPLNVPQHVWPVQSVALKHASEMPVHAADAVHELVLPASPTPGMSQHTMPVPQLVPPHGPLGPPPSNPPPSNPPPLLLPLPLELPLLLPLELPPLLPPLLPLLLPLPFELLLELHARAAPDKPIPTAMYKIRAFMKASRELPGAERSLQSPRTIVSRESRTAYLPHAVLVRPLDGRANPACDEAGGTT